MTLGGLARRFAPAPAALASVEPAVMACPAVRPDETAPAPDKAASVPPAIDANSAALPPIPIAEPALDAADATVLPTAVAASPAAARADIRNGSIPLIPAAIGES